MLLEGPNSGRMPSRRELILSAAAALALPVGHLKAAVPRRLRALVIGADRYLHIRKLERAVADADALEKWLSSAGYAVTSVRDGQLKEMAQAVGNFASATQTGDCVFFFFAGHGMQIGGLNFLLPIDVSAGSAESIADSALPFDAVLDQIADKSPWQSIAVLDACRNDPTEGSVAGLRRDFAATKAPLGFYVAYSAGTGEFALDKVGPDDRSPNGLFTRSLLENLSATSAFDAIIRRTRAQVSREAAKAGYDQHPATYEQNQRLYRLDGNRVIGDESISVPGTLVDLDCIIIGINNVGDMIVPEAIADAQSMDRLLRSLSAEPIMLLNSTKLQILEIVAKVASRSQRDILIYISAPGGLAEGEACIVTSTKRDPSLVKEDDYELLAMGEIFKTVRAQVSRPKEKNGDVRGFDFKSVADKKKERKQVSPVRKVVFMVDSTLSPLGGMKFKKPIAGDERVLAGMTDDMSFLATSGLALMYAAGVGQLAFAGSEGSFRGPFTQALGNVLTQPGLTLADVTNLVRIQTEQLTDGLQTPILLASTGMRNWVLVREAP